MDRAIMLPIKLCALFTALLLNAVAVERYAKVWVGQDGTVSVVTTDGRLLTPANDDGQVGAERALISADRESVGWLALYGSGSRPLPLRLVLLVDGKLRRFKGGFGEPIWYWCFQDGGRRIAFKEETPHGSVGLHYEQWDVKSGHRVADYTPRYDGNGRVVARPNEPRWVHDLEALQQGGR